MIGTSRSPTSPSQWDYDQDNANCVAIWLEIAQLGHHDKGIGKLASWQQEENKIKELCGVLRNMNDIQPGIGNRRRATSRSWLAFC